MPEIIAETRPTPEGEMLWRVSYSSSYYDDDCRGASTVEVGGTAYVLAKGMQEAIKKAEPAFKQARKDRDKHAAEKTVAEIVTIESLVAAVEYKPSSGWSPKDLARVSLTDPEDQARYKLAVCLVPVSG